jgi:hypothetical protein
VCITRQNNQGIYNAVTEGSRNGNGPTDTERTYGKCYDKDSLTFDTWYNIFNRNPSYMVGHNMCLHLIDEDQYYDLTFTWRQQSNNGG